MRRLSTRLLITQISISFLVSLILGISALILARSYFLDSVECAMDAQALLISEALDPEGAILSTISSTETAFNTMQQQVGNLSVEIQGLNTDPSTTFPLQEAQFLQIEAFEAIDLAVALVNSDGQTLLRPDRQDLPPSFGNSESIRQALQGIATVELVRSTESSWLVKNYPLVREESQQGVLTLGQPLDAIQAVLIDLGWMIAAAGVVALVIASLVSILSARGLLAPIAALTRASRSIPQGRFDERLPIERADELGELSRTFDEMRSKLEALEKLRAQFVSDVSHELRTPLTAIKGLAETLQDGAVEDPDVRDRFLASIEHETDRLIRMTQDLLTLTRIDGESLVLHLAPLDLLITLDSTLITLNPTIEAKQLQVTIKTNHDEVWLVADQDRLVQILFNLLDNAIQHAPPLSAIQIQIKLGTIKDASILSGCSLPQAYAGDKPSVASIEEDTNWIVLQIQDQGPGIQPGDLPHIFERFYRADIARARASGGAGLGLSIAQALVKEHSGHLWLHSPIMTSMNDTQHGTLAIMMLPASP